MADLKFLVEEWPAISRRLDEGLSLAPGLRDTWLASLVETDSIREKLRQLLVDAADVETGDFLEALPTMTAGSAEGETGSMTHDATAGAIIGPYRLIRELGVGGMGSVWLSDRVDGGLKRQVALKLPRLNWTQGLAERMSRERDILASLDHPNIARIYDAGLDEHGRPYLALEYVDGEPIDLHCRSRALSVPDRLLLLLQVARAVAHAHARLVVHRDLKPANILVTPDGQVRLLDFGIAKFMEGELTQETRLTQQSGRALTLDYASPEQIRGEAIGTASDVYSLGIVAYELLTEAKPYQLRRKSAAALEEAIASVDVRLASSAATPETRRELKGDIDAILNKALKKNVSERYPTVEAFAQDIERHLAKLPVHAFPDSTAYRARKFFGRNRLAIGAALIIFFSLATGAAVATWNAIEARKERVRADRVKDLIGSVFASANPYGAGKSDVSVRDLLKAGVEKVERELKGEPAASAELLSILSNSYRDLGEIDLALATARSANDLAVNAYSADHPVRARVLRVLAQAYEQKGNIKEAQGLLEQAIATQRALGDEGAVELAQSLGSLAGVALDQGRVEDAIALKRQAADLLTRARGAGDQLTISAIGELSDALMIGHHDKEALTEAERGYRLATEAFANPDHPITIDQVAHLAYSLVANGQYQSARDKWQSVVESQKKTFNPRGPQVAASLVGLGNAQECLGDLEGAAKSFQESLDIMNGYDAKVSGELAIRYYSLGRIALQSRRAADAIKNFDRAIEYGAATYGPNSGRVRDAENFRTTSLVYAGRLMEAQQVLEQQIAADRQKLNPALRMSLRNSVLLDWARGDVIAPLAKMNEVRDIESKVVGVPRRIMALTLSQLGRAQLDARRIDNMQLDRAAESLTNGVAMLREAVAMPTPESADAWVALGRARLEQGRLDDALPLFENALRFWEQFDATNAFAGEAAFWHGTALMMKHKEPLASQQLARSAELLAASSWPSHRQLALRARKLTPGSR